MATDFDDAADDAMAIVNGGPTLEQRDAIIRRLDEILAICATAGPDADGAVDVEPAWDYLDRLPVTPAQLLVQVRWPAAQQAALEHDEQFAAEVAALLGAPAVGRAAVLPLTCPAPEAHARYHAESETSWWRRARGHRERPEDGICRYCGKPLPKSHRRNHG